jgi:2-oxoglutarate ferredoxin oxidoreductase subunit delta
LIKTQLLKEKKMGEQLEPGAEMGNQPGEKPSEPHKEYEIDIFRDWCKQCGLCAAFCPQKCITLNENGAPVVDKSQKCTGCRWCELHCPDFAICVRERQTPQPKEGKED